MSTFSIKARKELEKQGIAKILIEIYSNEKSKRKCKARLPNRES